MINERQLQQPAINNGPAGAPPRETGKAGQQDGKDAGDKMADIPPQLQVGSWEDVYTYPPAVSCPECGGSGSIVLLVTARACQACEGSGKVWPEPVHKHTPPKLGYWRRERKFDELGRVVVETLFFEPVEEAAPASPEAQDLESGAGNKLEGEAGHEEGEGRAPRRQAAKSAKEEEK